MHNFSSMVAILVFALRFALFCSCSSCCGFCPGSFCFLVFLSRLRRGRPASPLRHGLHGLGPHCGPAAQPLQGCLAGPSASLRSVAAAALSWLLAPTPATPRRLRFPRHPLARAGTSWPAKAGLRRAPPRPV